MPERPYEKILHRELQKHDVEQHFSRQLEMLRDVVNYGTNLVPATLASSEKDLPDVIITSVLLKQVVRMLDAFEVLMASGCAPTCVLPARAAFEASVSMDWMLRDDSHLKARYFYVSNLRREAVWARRAIEGDSEHANFTEALGEFAEYLRDTQEHLGEGARKQVDEIERLLRERPYDEINREFDRTKGKKPYEPRWHAPSPLGVSSIRALCDKVGRLHEYEIFYTQFSETTHSSWYQEHIAIRSGHIELEPIRHLEGLGTLIRFATCVAFHTYQSALQRYRPGQLQEFTRRYDSDWRDAFTNIPPVTYNVVTDLR